MSDLPGAVTATAPGKLMLTGEYAVLEGAPALVCAVNRRAAATVAPRAHGEICVTAPDLGITAIGHRDAADGVCWDAHAETARRLRLVTHVLAAAARGTEVGDRAPDDWTAPGDCTRSDGCTVSLATTAFFDGHGTKFGLGSSAALAVALAGALAASAGRAAPTLTDLVATHRAAQGGHGSGADVAAALTGGILKYSGGDTDAPVARPTALPPGLHWCCVFTGRSTSTTRFLARVDDWRSVHPAAHRSRMTALTDTAAAAATAAESGDGAALLTAIDDYAAALDGLGTDVGIDIMSAEHREIRNLAARCGVVYKPSGAGGGDIGIGFSGDSTHIEALRRAISGHGYRMIDLSLEPQGLTVNGDELVGPAGRAR